MEELNTGLKEPSIEKILDAQGALPLASNISQKDSICELLVRHILIDSVDFLINEIKEGLNILGVLQSIQKHPGKFKELFCRECLPKLDAHMVDLIFVPKLDEEGSNKRAAQEQAIVYWRDYLQDCMGKPPKLISSIWSLSQNASKKPYLGHILWNFLKLNNHVPKTEKNYIYLVP